MMAYAPSFTLPPRRIVPMATCLFAILLLSAGCKPWHPYAGRIISYSPFGHTKLSKCADCGGWPCQCHLRGNCFPDAGCHGYRCTTWSKIGEACCVVPPAEGPGWNQQSIPAEPIPVPAAEFMGGSQPEPRRAVARREPTPRLAPRVQTEPRLSGSTTHRFGTALQRVVDPEPPQVRQGRLRGPRPAVRQGANPAEGVERSVIRRTSAEIEPFPPASSMRHHVSRTRPVRMASPYVFAPEIPAPSPPTALDELENDDYWEGATAESRELGDTPEEVVHFEPVRDRRDALTQPDYAAPEPRRR